MKKVFIFSTLTLIFFSFSFQKNRIKFEPYKSSYINLEEIKLQHLNDLEQLSLMLDNFRNHVSIKKLPELKKQLKEIRLQYKKAESFICYYSSDEAKFFLNSAPLPRLEKFVPEVNVLEPHGLQVLEEMIYSDFNKLSILNETSTIKTHLNSVIKYHKSLTLNHRHIFELYRQALIRTFTLGVSGFDSPCSPNAVNESLEVIKNLKVTIQPYIKYLDRSKNSNQLDTYIKETIAFLNTNHDFDTFDRYRYLKDFILPIYKKLYELQKEIGIETINEVNSLETAYNYEALSFFDDNFLNPSYFSSYEPSYNNDLTIQLGQILFFDPILSTNNKRACASCHQPEKAFTDGNKKSIALNFEGNINRNAPTVIDAIFSDRYFYDLKAEKIEKQFIHVIKNEHEFNTTYQEIFNKLNQSKEYQSLFKQAFTKHQNNPINTFTFSTALGAYISSLTSFNSKFDQSLKPNSEDLNKEQILGFNIFMGKGLCATCHFPPTFSGLVPPLYNENESEVIGVPKTKLANEIDSDLGRYNNGRHKEMSLIYKNSFKTTSVRNVALTAPYMHNGVYETLDEVIDFYNNGGGKGHGYSVPNQTLPFDSLKLNKEEISNIIAFLHSLSDTTGLTSIPTSLPSFGNDLLNKRTIGGRY
jgi:cytochrome c peroxidase